MSGDTDDLDSFEAELEGLLLQDRQLAPVSIDVTLRQELPSVARERFVLGETLGTGGAAAVVRVEDRDSGQALALKMLPVQGSSATQRARIRREFRAGRRLNHPQIVRTHEFFEGEKVWAFTMDLMDGTLRRTISRGPLPWETAVHITQEVLSALDHVHAKHVVHRDLKPENILLGGGENSSARLADFGIARFGELGGYSSLYNISGTPPYMPPEAFFERRFDPRGDLYALGLVFLEMLTGKHPIDATTADDWPQRHQTFEAERPDDLPDALWDLILQLTHRDPDRRVRTAKQAFDTLAQVIQPRTPIPNLSGARYVASTALVGRDDTVARAEEWVQGRLRGEGLPVSWLSGPAGIGKSRILQRLAAMDGKFRVLVGRGQRHARHPFSTLSSVLSAISAPQPPQDDAVATPHTFRLTDTGMLSNQTGELGDDGTRVAHRVVLQNLIDSIIAAANDRPLLLIVEDLHWADEASIELLESLARAMREQPCSLAVVLTSRPLDAAPQAAGMKQRLLADGLVHATNLEPLTLAATEELVAALLMDDARSDELARRIHQEGETTPLLVVQTLHVLAGRGALSQPDEVALMQLPSSVQNAVGERVARLSGMAKALLGMAAVLGSEFTVTELQACLTLQPLEILDYLDEAEQEGFVEPSRAGEVYRFSHEELRDALTEGMEADNAELHRRAADALIHVHAEEAVAGRVARHLEICEDWPLVWRWGRLAGEVALRGRSFREGATSFDRAFEAAQRCGIQPQPSDWEQWGDALMYSDRNDEAAKAFEAALERLPENHVHEVVILGKLAELEYRSSRLSQAVEPLVALLPRLGASVPQTDDEVAAVLEKLHAELVDDTLIEPVPPEDAQRLEVLCNTYRNLAEVAYYFKSERKDYFAAQCARLALRLRTTPAAAQGFGLYGFLTVQEGRFEAFHNVAKRAVVAANACGDPVSAMFARSMTASGHVMAGEPQIGIAESTAAWEAAQKIAEPLRLMTVASIQALTLSLLGRTDEALEVAETMRRISARHGYRRVWEMAHLNGAAAALYGTRFERVLEFADVADELEQRGSRMLALQLRSYASVARAFLEPARGPSEALDVAEQWASEGFGSMMCHPDTNALIVARITATTPTDEDRERLREAVARGWDVAHRNRAKTGLFLVAAGLFEASDGRPTDWAEQGRDFLEAQEMWGDLSLLAAVEARAGV